MKRTRLSNREIKELRETYNFMTSILEEADVVEVAHVSEKQHIYLVDGEPLFLKVSEGELGVFVVPTLYLIHKSSKNRLLPQYPKAVVDQGAVVRIIKGADIMRPGIKSFVGDFNKGDIVFVTDEKNRVIAISVALYSKSEIEQMQKGKVLINLHHLGDKIWEISLKLVKEKS
ncbi:RNA-binding protein, containing PUA domain [Pyrobaculum islandicum DSM 4184]|uniref:RNA-binding protein, containing PUA domain n=1 Tax=Pyrobaculum islandicum (strain DSM 4184 / JCM 9189 / GEO3) TaxID=384616 RepID=A1RV24_PYRIL|nr:RNA-binding protein [Pyrobaculum islandicum]ABL88806.1 RNA-binding protein, containing PUA domain [Pyrobaculum islandicum DSM 4184]